MSKRVMGAIVAATACAALLLGGCSRESADWKQASVANTPEAYQLFLQQHPHAAEAPQAQSRLQQLTEQRDWQIASTTDTRDGYQQFVTKHPDSKWVQEARIRIENFAQAGVSGGAALAANPAGEPAAGAVAGSGSSISAVAKAAAAGSPTAAARASTAARASASVRTVSRSHANTRSVAARRAHSALVARAHRAAHSRTPLLQLGAFRSKARAQSEWRQLTARFGTLRSFTPRYVVARSRGTRVVRLQVRVPSTRVASGLCATLRRHARPCVRVTAA